MTAKQNIERAKGAMIERKWLMGRIREINRLYGGKDNILNVLIQELKDRQVSAEKELA